MIRESVELEVQLIDDLLDLTKISRYCLVLMFSLSLCVCVCVWRYKRENLPLFAPLPRRNKLKLHLQEVSVHELLNRTLQIVAHEIGVKKLRVSMHLDGDFDRLTGDPARFIPPPSIHLCAKMFYQDSNLAGSPPLCAGCSKCFGILSRCDISCAYAHYRCRNATHGHFVL